MSKASNKGVDYGKFDPYFIEQVKGVIAEADRHKYSVSRVYGAYNKAHGKNDKPQTCSSCLRNRVRELRKWYEGYTKFEAEQKKTLKAGIGNTDTGVDLGTAEGDTHVETFIIIDGEAFTVVDEETNEPTTVIFTPSEEGAAFGKATDVKGKPAPPYVYEQNGKAYLVSGDEGNYTEVTGEPIAEVKDVEPQYSDPVAPGFVAPALGVIRIPLTEGLPIDFTPNKDNAEKGKVKYADGTAVKAGTYATATGDEIAVQPGGKATLKNNDLL